MPVRVIQSVDIGFKAMENILIRMVLSVNYNNNAKRISLRTNVVHVEC